MKWLAIACALGVALCWGMYGPTLSNARSPNREWGPFKPYVFIGVAYLVLTIFISPITMFLMANEVEKLYLDAGEQPRITTLWGLWFLLPLIGNIIWYVRIQNAINEFWQARGGTTSPGLA